MNTSDSHPPEPRTSLPRERITSEVEQLLLEAVDDEPATEWTEKDVEAILRAGRRAIEKRKRA